MKNLFVLVVLLSFPLLAFFEFDRAISYQEAGDWKSSLSFLEKQLIDQPDNPLYLYHAGLAHYRLNNFEFAQNYFEKFTHFVDQNDIQARVKGFFNQGNALYKAHKFESAIAAYDSALFFDSQNEYVLTNKKLAEEQLKQQNNQQQDQNQQQSQDNNQNNNQGSDQKKNNQSQSEKNKNQPNDPNQSDDRERLDQEKKNDENKNSDMNEQKENKKKNDADDNQKSSNDSNSDEGKKESDESSIQEPEKSEKDSESKNDSIQESSKKEKNTQNSEDSTSQEGKQDQSNVPRHNQPEPKNKNAMNYSIDEEKNQERIKKLQELEQANDELVESKDLLELLKDQEMHDQQDNKALMRALAKSKNALKVQENGW